MIEWIPLVTRKESPLWVSLVCLGGERTYFQNALGWNYEIKNYKYENQTHSIAVPDAVALQQRIDANSRSGDFFADYLSRCEISTKALDNIADELHRDFAQDPQRKRSKSELADTFVRFGEGVRGAMPFLASLVLVQDRLEASLRTQIGDALGKSPKSEQVTEVLSSCVVAPNANNVVLESRNILRLAAQLEAADFNAQRLNDSAQKVLKLIETRLKGFSILLENHINEYGWLRTFTYFGEPFSIDEMLERIRGSLEKGNCQERLSSSEIRHRDEVAQARHKINELFGDSPLSSLLHLAGDYLYWRFERIDAHFRSEVRVRSLERAIASAAGLTREKLIHSTYPEILGWLQGHADALPSHAIITERMIHGFDCFLSDGEFSVQNRQLLSLNSSAHAEDANQYSLPLTGTTACPGEVTGIARLVLSADDINKVSNGEILVTTMTTPDLMLAIERCGAIITDEGGLLCHAAIISRELQIPCVIGTEAATKAIRDGDFIIVDANGPEGHIRWAEDSQFTTGSEDS